MNIVWSPEIDTILNIGISLNDVGVNNWALNRVDALDAIDKLDKLSIAILGGDVYTQVNNQLELSYDNWYCDQFEGESEIAFHVRSINMARSYVSNYDPSNSNIYIALVPSVVN